MIDCDKSGHECNGGYANRVLGWGKRKGFIPESCYEYKGKKQECKEDHLDTNECRVNNTFYRVIDFCLA